MKTNWPCICRFIVPCTASCCLCLYSLSCGDQTWECFVAAAAAVCFLWESLFSHEEQRCRSHAWDSEKALKTLETKLLLPIWWESQGSKGLPSLCPCSFLLCPQEAGDRHFKKRKLGYKDGSAVTSTGWACGNLSRINTLTLVISGKQEMSQEDWSQNSSWKGLDLGPVCILILNLKTTRWVRKQGRFYRRGHGSQLFLFLEYVIVDWCKLWAFVVILLRAMTHCFTCFSRSLCSRWHVKSCLEMSSTSNALSKS